MGRYVGFLWLLACSLTHAGVLYDTPLPGESKWSSVTPAGSLLIGGKNYLTHVDQNTGQALWTRDDLKNLAAFNVRVIPGTSLLSINELTSKIPMKSRLQVVDLMSGETLWDTGSVNGSNLGGFPLADRGIVIYVRDIAGQRGTKPGTYISAHELGSGTERWRTRIGVVGTPPRHRIDDNGFISGTDLSGHPDPLVIDDTFVLVAGDLRGFNLETGEELWRYKLKGSHPALKGTYARPLLIDGVVVAAGSNRVVAVDPRTGKEIWSTKITKGAIPELIRVGDRIIARLGGSFSDGKKVAQLKPFGAAVLTTGGKLEWLWKKGKSSITNLAVLPEQNLIAFADKKKLYGFDLAGNGKPRFEMPLKFKRKMGKAEIAAKALGGVGGFLGGGLGGAAQSMAGGGDRSDPPLDITAIGNNLVVRGQQHVLAYDVTNQSTPWSVQFAPPGVNNFALLAMGAVTLQMSAMNAQSMWSSSSPSTVWMYRNNTANLNNAYQDEVSKRFAASERSEKLAFFLTQDEGVRKLVGLNLANGAEVGTIPMNEKEPQFVIDELGSRVYYFPEKKSVRAVTY